MKFSIGTVSNSLEFEETYKLIKSSLLYADELELIGMAEYAIFKYLPGRIQSVNDINTLLDSFIPFFKAIKNDESQMIVNELEGIKKQLLPYYSVLKKNKNRSKEEIIAQMKVKKLVSEGKEQFKKMVSQFSNIANVKEIKQLISNNIISVYDYECEDFDFDLLAGGYFGNLLGLIQNHIAYPLFDKTSNEIISSFSQNKLLDLGCIKQDVLVHAGVANNILMTLPTLEEASIDEILSFKKEMERPLVNFRNAIYKFSEKVNSKPWDKDFKYDCLKIYHTEVAPKVEELNELSTETSVLKNFGKRVFLDGEFRKKTAFATGGLITAITTTSNIFGAIDAIKEWMMSLSMMFIAPNIVSAFLKTFSIRNEAKEEVKKIDKEMRGNSMYYYYKAHKDL